MIWRTQIKKVEKNRNRHIYYRLKYKFCGYVRYYKLVEEIK